MRLIFLQSIIIACKIDCKENVVKLFSNVYFKLVQRQTGRQIIHIAVHLGSQIKIISYCIPQFLALPSALRSLLTPYFLLLAPHSPKNNIINRLPKIPPLRPHRVFHVGVYVFSFRFTYLVECLRQIGVEWRYQPRHNCLSQFLKVFGIEIKIMIAQGPNPYQVHFPFYPVIQHGKFIQPCPSHKPAQGCNSKIILDLSTLLQLVLLVNIFLEIFGIGLHGPEFIHVKIAAIQPHPAEFDKGTV